jgi:hypothetical protein
MPLLIFTNQNHIATACVHVLCCLLMLVIARQTSCAAALELHPSMHLICCTLSMLTLLGQPTHALQADQLESRCNTLKFEMQKLIDDDDTCALMQLTELSQRGTIGAADLASVDSSEAELLLEE